MTTAPMTPNADGLPLRIAPGTGTDVLLNREWLVTNGLGGYASGTVAGVPTRRYHGLLVAALDAPLGRTLLMGPLAEQVRTSGGKVVRLAGAEYRGGRLELEDSCSRLIEFGLDAGLPVWRYDLDGAVLEKRLWMPYRTNAVMVTYRLVHGEGTVRLKLRPALHVRPHESPVDTPLPGPFRLAFEDGRLELAAPGAPAVRLRLLGEHQAFTIEPRQIHELLFRVEASRGYEHDGDLYSPGYFRADLSAGRPVTLVAGVESWDTLDALPPEQSALAERERRSRLIQAAHPSARTGVGAELVLAADQFMILPATRRAEATSQRAAGDEPRSVIAGYHWFTDWGRDTMISLEGLALTTGRHAEAGSILRTFARHARNGLIPNYFPDGETEGVYHTADATLWFFHAVSRYVDATGDRQTLRGLLPLLEEIVAKHLAGTRFGIGVDPADGLLKQGAEGYQLTWMDAKVDGWVVTPRRGKAVEINALWYNALMSLATFLQEERGAGAAESIREHAVRCRESFNRRFPNSATGYLFDVVDAEGGGDDAACRPNQVLAISLPFPVLNESHWPGVLGAVREKLLTPAGLRTLSPDHPDYKSRYDGDLRSRDAAYHQGTVWPWLLGPFIDAWLKLYPTDTAGARALLAGLLPHLDDACVGSVSEVFDAEAPYVPRGCVAQAWSVAEALRCWARTSEG